MLFFIIRLVISAGALFFIAGASGGSIQVNSTVAAIIAALLLGIVNAVVKPILQFIAGTLTLPLSCITLGLWSLMLSWLINAFLFFAVGSVVNGFKVQGFAAAMWGSLALSIVNAIATAIFSEKDDK